MIGSFVDQTEKSKSCQCRKSNCLKLYCDCFQGGGYCGPYCACAECENDGADKNQFSRNKVILACLGKDPHAFRPVVGATKTNQLGFLAGGLGSSTKRVDQLCNCTKSKCLKKYCECFRRSDYCGSQCKCVQCDNVKDNKEREQLVAPVGRKKASLKPPPTAAGIGGKGDTGRFSVASAVTTTTHASGAASGAASRAAYPTTDGTIDLLPPSYYATPMRLPGGVASATLAFGQSLSATSRNRKAEGGPNGDSRSAYERAMATEEAVLARRRSREEGNNHTSRPDGATSADERLSTKRHLERKWAEETRDVLGTFQAMRKELLRRKQDAGLLGGSIVLSREYSYYDLVASAQLASIELDLADILASVREAEDQARQRISRENEASARGVAGHEAGHSGGCQETQIEGRTSKLSESEKDKEVTAIQAAQDAALMRELARIVRRRTLEMREARMCRRPRTMR